MADRLADLPSVLKQAVSVFEAVSAPLPPRLTSGLLQLPGFGEYARMIESLTAVSYFDAVSAQTSIPAQRDPAGSPVVLEPMA